ncbi:putative bifunctional diguanylate cyclase/phosphodiesterase [Cognatilysobacter segetis]|uniref:putative bifunctional diguanylate cyclase/phosphodiesterase n=1 Tax=Cognatilysobacter segetis TaxID=2492394 RepID=UPI00105F1AB7|nr:EAL domain-containing protein [Lysobacter segetis]
MVRWRGRYRWQRGLPWLFAAALLLAGLPTHVAMAQARGADRAVRFQADHDYPPFSFVDPATGPSGYDIDLFRDAARRAGLRADIRLDDWLAVQTRLSAGTIDVVPMLVTPERQQRLLFSQPYLQRHHLVFGRRGDRFVASLDQLAGRRVAVQRAGRAWQAMTAVPGARIVLVDKEGDTLRGVADGRADVAVAPSNTAFYARRRFHIDDVVPLSPPVLGSDYAFAMPPDRFDLKRRLDAGLQETIRSGAADRIYLRWLGDLTPASESYRSGMLVALWVVLPLAGIALFFLLRWLRMRRLAATAMHSQRNAEDEALRLLHHDPVTGVFNAAGLRERLGERVARATPFGLVRIDLLDLHLTESITGHAFTDDLLRELGDRLATRSGRPVVASVGRGTFYLVCHDAVDGPTAAAAMDELLALASRRVEIDGVPLDPSCAAGTALFPLHAEQAGPLMRAATIACTAAAAMPGSGVVYTPALDPDPRNLTLLTDLRRAIADRSLGFALQAKFDLASGKVCGAEMLVRWTHPEHGPLPPSHFVPLAERTQVIGEMTLYLIDHAVALCRQWTGHKLSIELAVNVSANDLVDPRVVAGIVEQVREAPGCLVLEITETAVMRDAERALAAVRELRSHGVRISLDDFGTGNASLTYLRQLRPDEVKIDRTFIAGVIGSETDRAIVRSTIELAHSLGAKVTAEGVEDEETLDWLRRVGADSAQGFGLALPEPVALFHRRVGFDAGAADA